MSACDLSSDPSLPGASPAREEAFVLTATDRKIVLATQQGMPITEKPFDVLAAQLGIGVDELLARLERMQAAGVIRRIAAVPNHYRIGYQANGMTVWDIPDAHVAEVGPRIGRLDFVSHCYHRPRHLPDWPYNVFAMVHGKTRDEVEAKALQIKTLLGDLCRASDILYSKRILKKTGLRIRPRNE